MLGFIAQGVAIMEILGVLVAVVLLHYFIKLFDK
jgi:hypothetical protein